MEDLIDGDHPLDDARRTVLVEDEVEEETPVPRQRPSLSVTVAPAEEPLPRIRSRSGDLQDLEISSLSISQPLQPADTQEVASNDIKRTDTVAPIENENAELVADSQSIENQEESNPTEQQPSSAESGEEHECSNPPPHNSFDSIHHPSNEELVVSGSSDNQAHNADPFQDTSEEEAKFHSILDVGSLDAVPKFIPTKEWVDKLKASLPLSTIMKLLNYLGPLVEHVASQGGSLDALMQLIEDTMMVGILPIPHPIVIRKHSSNQHTSAWMASFLWDLIRQSQHKLPLFDLKHVKLFDVDYA